MFHLFLLVFASLASSRPRWAVGRELREIVSSSWRMSGRVVKWGMEKEASQRKTPQRHTISGIGAFSLYPFHIA